MTSDEHPVHIFDDLGVHYVLPINEFGGFLRLINRLHHEEKDSKDWHNVYNQLVQQYGKYSKAVLKQHHHH